MKNTPFQDSILWEGKWKSLKNPDYAHGKISIYFNEPYYVSQVYITNIKIYYEGVFNKGNKINQNGLVKIWSIKGDDIVKDNKWLHTIEMELPHEYIKYFITNKKSDKIEGFYVCTYYDDTGPFVLYKS